MTKLSPYQSIAALLTLLMLLVLGLMYRERLDPGQFRVPHLDDTALHGACITRIAEGEPYYAAVGTELRTRGYPSASVANWRTPLHYRMVAALGPVGSAVTLWGSALLAILLGALSVGARLPHRGAAAAVVLLGTMLLVLVNPAQATVYAENWAGILIALSIANYHLRLFPLAAVAGVAAIFMRELAVPYALVCGALALRHRRRGEAVVWVVGGVAFVAYYALHAATVTAAMQPGDYAWPHSWVRALGWPFVLQTAWASGWTMLLPYAMTSLIAVLSLSGTAARSMPAQLRLSLLTYVVLFSFVGQEFNFYWGWVTAPLWAYALLYCPEGLSTLLTTSRRTFASAT